ncbi:MAG TPA: nitrilase-related carbon-nitrogen hydrolase [Phototrophicaceae bacterium]|nr:nitrilase-related carbon-nitrogen hydrolase [Phototrophicaceae bacterium]
MQDLRIALIQLGWAGSRDAMAERYRPLIAQAVQTGAALICLPELSLSPYFPGTTDPAGFSWAEPLHGGASDVLFSELARQHGVTIISSIFEHTPDGHYYDTAIIHNPRGELSGVTRKIHLPYGEGYNETDFFEPSDAYPVFNVGALTVAAPTCYDQWFPELARIYSLNGAELIFYPTAIGSEPTDPNIDTAEAWQTIMRGHAIANGVYVGAANRIGIENGVTFYGSSFLCDPMGRILTQAGRATTEVITADLTAAMLEHWRRLFPLLRQRMPQTYGRIVQAEGGQSA